MLEVNNIFDKLSVLDIPSDRGLCISYNDEAKIINLFEETLSNIVAQNIYSLAEYLGSKDIQFDTIEKVENGIYRLV